MIILNGQEAFAAMAAGQNIECRHTGSDLDFDSIRNFPATVFFDPDHEFRIAVVYMTIGTMQVPEAISEAPAKGTPCFAPSLLTAELSKAFKWKNSESDLELLARGLVHLYEDNAVVHAQALITVSGGSLNKEEPVSDTSLPWENEPATEAENIQIQTSNDVEEKTLEQYTPRHEHTADNLSVEELKRLQVEAENLVAVKKLAADDNDKYQTLLSELLEGVANAKTPAEVNAHTRYTKPWTEEQRKPLLNAIHKRLQEIARTEVEINTPPSLMVQIQNAPDLAALDSLEIDVSARSPEIQPKLMDYVKKRRFELENQASEVVQ